MAKKPTSKKPEKTLSKAIGYILVACAVVGLVASSILLLEKMALLQDPNYKPSCNINPIISCGSVMKTEQASLFGVSNSFVGMIGFSVVMTIGFAVLAGAKFKAWFWRALQVGTLFGVIFSHWLFYQGVYTIGAICPYCAAIWVIMIVLFWYTLMYNLREGHIVAPTRLKRVANLAQKYHGDVIAVWLVGLVLIILVHFWYYWSTLL